MRNVLVGEWRTKGGVKVIIPNWQGDLRGHVTGFFVINKGWYPVKFRSVDGKFLHGNPGQDLITPGSLLNLHEQITRGYYRTEEPNSNRARQSSTGRLPDL